ncbi:hypothetical protein L9F63_009014, partial [Diploptera punctata]
FKWKSFRVFYTIVCIAGACFNIATSILLLKSQGVIYERVDKVVFYGTSAIVYFKFLMIAKKWPILGKEWENVEQSQKHYGYPKKLCIKINIITTIILFGAFVEHGLAHINILKWAGCCQGDNLSVLKQYFTNVHSQLFNIIPYNMPLAFINAFLNITATFSWNFTDLFIILLSLSIAARFQLLNLNLKSIKGKVQHENFWKQIREEYNSLSELTKMVNSCITLTVLISYSNNLYFICRQLLSSLLPLGNTTETIYFYWSFGFVLFRTIMVSLFAANINDESQYAKEVIYSIPSENYGTEVSFPFYNIILKNVIRLLQQITTDDVVLTGMNFFSVTRTLLLT